MRPKLATLLLAPLLLLSGCVNSLADTSSPEPVETAAVNATTVTRATPVAAHETAVDTPVVYEGRITEAACTFGSLRHECTQLARPGLNEFYEVSFEGDGRWVEGTVALADGPTQPPRVDIFLVHREPGGSWEVNFPDDPYASGPSPVSFSWNLSAYPGKEFAFFVFASRAVGTGVAGVSYAPSHPFSVEAIVTSAMS